MVSSNMTIAYQIFNILNGCHLPGSEPRSSDTEVVSFDESPSPISAKKIIPIYIRLAMITLNANDLISSDVDTARTYPKKTEITSRLSTNIIILKTDLSVES